MASEKINREEIVQPENVVYQKPELLNDVPMHYCPGCSHGVVHKLVAEVIADMGMEEKAVGVSPVGCAVFAYRYIDIDWQEAAHGRAPALATAIKRLWPDRLVFTYQGDGDLACIGTAETIHALNRGENIVIIFINNAELAAKLRGTCYVTRQSVDTVASVMQAKKAIRKAFEASMKGMGSSLVEIVSTCSSGWHLSPVKANEWMRKYMFEEYHKGDFKDTTGLK